MVAAIFIAILKGVTALRNLKKYKPTRFKAKNSHYDADAADFAVAFIESLCHTKGTWAATPEGRIVRMADQIAYVNHDIEDAVRAGVLDPDILPKDCTAVLGTTKSARITTMINSILRNSDGNVRVGTEENEAFLALRDFMYATVYVDKTAKREEQKVDKVIGELYDYYLNHIDRMSNFYVQLAYQEGRDRAVTDYISGMSDEFAIRTFEELFVPQKWHVL